MRSYHPYPYLPPSEGEGLNRNFPENRGHQFWLENFRGTTMKAEKRSWQPPEFVSREQCIKDTERIPLGADGKKAGFFLLHGGSGDFKGIERHSKLLASKFGFKVVAGTFPGRFYFPDASRDWLGDTIHPDGTVRTPIWKQGEVIAPDEYEIVKDPSKRNRYGTR